ncbi:hypothetical protein LX88_003650 [Lentzea californiensis]|nr:hypothetical protein [Lentzea californiensis]
MTYQAMDTAKPAHLSVNKTTRSVTRRLVRTASFGPSRDQVTADDGERSVEEANLMATAVLVRQDLIQRDRTEAGPAGLVDRVGAETADADIANAQVFFVLPAVVTEAKLEPILAGRCSAQQRVGHEVLDAPSAEEVVVVWIGSKRSCTTRESTDECGQEAKIRIRIKEVACPGCLDLHVFHPLVNLSADAIAVHRIRWGPLRTRTARLACEVPAYRLLLPPVRHNEPQAPRNAVCRGGQIVTRQPVMQPPDFLQHPQPRRGGHATSTRWRGHLRLNQVVQIRRAVLPSRRR